MSRRRLSTPMKPFEGAASYVSRVAALYAAPDARTFASWFGADFREVCAGSKRDLQKMSDILQKSVAVLTDGIVVGTSKTACVGGLRMPRDFLSSVHDRVCPACLKDDIDNGAGSTKLRPYARITWLLRPLRTCPRHSVRLQRIGSLKWDQGDDFLLRLENARLSGELSDGAPAEPSPLDRYIVGRIEGFDHRPSWLDDMSLPAVLRICEAFGRDKDYRGHARPLELGNADRINDGFDRVAISEQAFRDEVRQMIERNFPRRSFTAYNVFADLPYEFLDDLRHEEFSTAARVMRAVALEILPLGPGDDMFGEIHERRFHTVRTASRELEIGSRAVWTALKKVVELDADHDDLRMLFDPSLLSAISLKLPDTDPAIRSARARFKRTMEREREFAKGDANIMSVASNSFRLEIKASLDVLWSLSDEGYLPIVLSPKRPGHWRIPIDAAAEFRRRYISRIELNALLRDRNQLSDVPLIEAFSPVIDRSEVGDDFYDRGTIMQSI